MIAHTQSRHVVGRRLTVLAVAGLAVVVVFGSVACADLATSDSGSSATTISTPTTPSSGAPPTEPGPASTSTTGRPAAGPVSEESLAYASSIGGTSHMGEELYFVIGASVRSEAQAKALLEPAKAVGDMQSSFIVQLSDNFDGMRAGYWVVFEAYDGYPSVEDLEFCRRPFPEAYVKRATVMTDDPIPVRPGG